jgi:uncharacterized membrane protein
MSMVLLLGAGAMGVDIGFTVYGSRSAQAMADTAALDLAQDIPTIDAEPSNSAVTSYITSMLNGVLTDNGSNATLTATPGVWQNGAFTTLSDGCSGTVFLTPPLACNAIKVSANQAVPQPFWGGFNLLNGNGRGGSGSSGPTTIAAWEPWDWFSIGSYLASFNTQQSGVLNKLIGRLGSANVTLVGYQGLANTYVSLKDLITASGGVLTTSNIMTATLTSSQWLTIWTNAVANQTASLSCGSSPTPTPCEASTGLGALTFNSSASAQLCQMVSINGSTCSSATLSTSDLSASVDLLQMLTTEAELANGSDALDVTSALSLPNVSSASLTLNLIQPAAERDGTPGSDTTAGPPCSSTSTTKVCAETAQVSSDLKLTVLSVLGAGISIDIPLSAAIGYATLNSVSCSNMVFQNATINVTTTAASGTVTQNGVSIGTLTVNGVSNKAGTFSTVPPTTASETSSPPTNPRNFGTTTPSLNYSSSLSALDLNVQTLLTANLPPVLGKILQVAGAQVGGAQVTDTKAICDHVVIVS